MYQVLVLIWGAGYLWNIYNLVKVLKKLDRKYASLYMILRITIYPLDYLARWATKVRIPIA